jgi:hypothetical protein
MSSSSIFNVERIKKEVLYADFKELTSNLQEGAEGKKRNTSI